jgi:hypothetical protein
MPRLFEILGRDGNSDSQVLVDLDKVCMVRVKKQDGHHYPRVLVRFVDGHETHDAIPPDHSQQFLDAYREHLRR